ncbi:YraN family protein [Patescibacteria group bacterium]|nr:YraN family protein [Patescibacteria group bacterium]
MPNHIRIGQIGEDIACQYLVDKKYKIIERNVRYPWGEIDVICRKKDKTLVFVEVKALKMFHTSVKQNEKCFTDCFSPENNLNPAKFKKVKRTVLLYANSHPELIDEEKGWQIDLIAIEIYLQNPKDLNLKELFKNSEIRHYENI